MKTKEPDDKNTDRATIDVKVFKVCTIEFIIQLIALVLWTIPQNPQIDTRGLLWLFADFMTCQDRCRRHRCQHPYVVSNISARLFFGRRHKNSRPKKLKLKNLFPKTQKSGKFSLDLYPNLHNLFKNGTKISENSIILSKLKEKCQKNSIFRQIH